MDGSGFDVDILFRSFDSQTCQLPDLWVLVYIKLFL